MKGLEERRWDICQRFLNNEADENEVVRELEQTGLSVEKAISYLDQHMTGYEVATFYS